MLYFIITFFVAIYIATKITKLWIKFFLLFVIFLNFYIFFSVNSSLEKINTVKKWIDDCMITYVDEWCATWYWYYTAWNTLHIDCEPIIDWTYQLLDEPKGCVFWNLKHPIWSINNTIYCLTYKLWKK
jgi:hypothetical protein